MAHLDRGVVYTSRGEDGRSWWGPGDVYTFLVTGEESGGSLFALDCLVGAGGGPPPHRHLAEDELFAITEGSIRFTAALSLPASPSSSHAAPRTSTETTERRRHE
jgi:hypothetical protein